MNFSFLQIVILQLLSLWIDGVNNSNADFLRNFSLFCLFLEVPVGNLAKWLLHNLFFFFGTIGNIDMQGKKISDFAVTCAN